MTAPTDPAEVVRAVCDGVSRLAAGRLGQAQLDEQLDRLAALYAEHTDVRHPFAASDGAPMRTRAELRRHFAQVPGPPGRIERFAPAGFRVHRTSDPEVVVTEFRYEGAAGGRAFSLPCIFVTRVRDGMITESRDYGDRAAAARAFGPP